jgi:hypothetical protein
MTSTRLAYTGDIFPFANVLGELTIELQKHPLGPIAAYARFQQLRKSYGLLSGADYCSTAITSSGHARRLELPKPEVIRRNTDNARQLVVELAEKGSIDPRSVILPVDLGNIPSWQQSDYITFWLAVIAGLDMGRRPRASSIARLEASLLTYLTALQVDLVCMNNSGAQPQVRAAEYFKFSHAFAAVTSTFRPEPNSAHRVINLIDTESSLGCQTERLYAHLRGIPTFNVAVSGPATAKQLAFRDISLYKDLELIFRYGGASVELAKEYSFILEQQPNSGFVVGTATLLESK